MRSLPCRCLLPALFTLLLLTGCTGGPPAGAWVADPQVRQLFESGTLLPDHSYYYLGSFGAPDSIMAIDNRYTLRSQVWAGAKVDQHLLNGWLQWYRSEHHPPGCQFRGGRILTPDGRQAGVWYSQNIVNIVRLPEPGVLEVFQPHSPSGPTCGRDNNANFLFGE
ncbi:MAG: hypothetical protein RBT36_01585 [Desulfobulbus sp.]|jgi:hypothetical protein|nr:hypothetical protein [Desulfobulbus sp.]